MKQSIVTVIKENKIVSNHFFTNIEAGESKFKEECLKLEHSIDSEEMEELLDDGYYNNHGVTVCLNSFNHDFEPTHAVFYVKDNCVDFMAIHYNKYELKNVFRDMIAMNASNGDEYSSEDIDKCMDDGVETINGNKIYFFKL